MTASVPNVDDPQVFNHRFAAFVVNRGGDYSFIPSLSALRWLSELDT